jgi:lysophospholipase L1-like esterase
VNTVSSPSNISSAVPTAETAGARSRASRFAPAVSVVVTLIVCLLMLEFGLRWIDRYQVGNTEGYFAQEGPYYGLKKNAAKQVNWPNVEWNVYTDEYGFRAPKTGPRDLDSKPYYAFLGASDVFANGLDYETSWVGVFASKLAADQMEVANLGVGGHHLLEQTARLKLSQTMLKRPPNYVVIALNPLLIGGYDDVHASVVVKHGEMFEQDNWRLPLLKMVLAGHSAAYSFFRDGVRNTQARYFEGPDFSLDFYIQRYSTQLAVRRPEKMADYFRHLEELENYVRCIGATPIEVYVPATGGFLLNKLKAEGKVDGSLFDTKFFRDISERHAAEAGITYVDLEPMLQERYDRGEKLNFDLDAHFNAPTAKVVGEYLYQALAPGVLAARVNRDQTKTQCQSSSPK